MRDKGFRIVAALIVGAAVLIIPVANVAKKHAIERVVGHEISWTDYFLIAAK